MLLRRKQFAIGLHNLLSLVPFFEISGHYGVDEFLAAYGAYYELEREGLGNFALSEFTVDHVFEKVDDQVVLGLVFIGVFLLYYIQELLKLDLATAVVIDGINDAFDIVPVLGNAE